jgi:hypothetical protein
MVTAKSTLSHVVTEFPAFFGTQYITVSTGCCPELENLLVTVPLALRADKRSRHGPQGNGRYKGKIVQESRHSTRPLQQARSTETIAISE